jgi:hypothetical protein
MFLTSIFFHQHLFPLSTLLMQEQALARQLQGDSIFMQQNNIAALVDEQKGAQDQNVKQSYLITHPLPNDVLFGRGRPLQAHHGNLRFHRIVNRFREKYRNARKDEKVSTAGATHASDCKIKPAILTSYVTRNAFLSRQLSLQLS